MIKVLVFGTFDGLHEGHLDMFRQARQLGDRLIVVVGRDSSVKLVKKKTPKFNEQERLKAARDCNLIDEAMLGTESHDPNKDRYDIILSVKPDIVCLGYDQSQFAKRLQDELRGMGLSGTKIEILKPYQPEKYHSSIIHQKNIL